MFSKLKLSLGAGIASIVGLGSVIAAHAATPTWEEIQASSTSALGTAVGYGIALFFAAIVVIALAYFGVKGTKWGISYLAGKIFGRRT